MKLFCFTTSLILFLSAVLTAHISLGAEKKPALKAEKKQPEIGSFFEGKLKLSVQERLRFEYRENNFDFDGSQNAVTDDEFLLQRVRVGLTALPANGIKLMLEVQDAREFDSKRANVPGVLGAEGDDEFDLRQAWVQMGDAKEFPVSLKIGRMTWKYGDERLIGDFDWKNIGRTFDGFVIHSDMDKAWLDFIFGSPVIIKPNDFNTNDGQDRLMGAYYSTTQWLDQTTEFYTLYRNHVNEVNNGQAQETWTQGARIKSMPEKYGPWGYEAEIAGQFGKVRTGSNSLDHEAFASHIQGSYTWSKVSWQPTASVLYDYGSGDSNPTDDRDTGFQNLFPTNHKFYGSMDLFSWRNIHDLGVSVLAKATKSTTAKLELHSFWLPQTADAWYRANGSTAIRASSADRDVDDHVGEEIDLTVNHSINRYVSVGGGYSHFFTGGFVSATGASSDANFGYLMITAGF
jgi:hypothetical protein